MYLTKSIHGIKYFFKLFLSVPLLLMSSVSLGADNNIEIVGTVIAPPPCRLNNNEVINVDFGNSIGVKKVASGQYRQEIVLDLTCDAYNDAWQLTLKVTGLAVDFDSDNATLQTAEKSDLGIKLYADGKAFPLLTAININGTVLPKVEAVLVQREGVELTEGPFTAKAILKAEYQ
ncbi:fimbrial protein [Enterobacter sp. Cy-643]|uniref:fimbrial protein n=1 Tax=Enterobacter sp. Cy-643 TaxID=2608346 RepID=UPI0014209DAC|nr:fimbrial protein [Enterobacter sp. Cy-643]NIF33011.1 fimbrial protein [Enterobacter sp. Cy-643]